MTMRIDGLDELISTLVDPNLVGQPSREALIEAALIVEIAVKEGMPVDTGFARQRITHELDQKGSVPNFSRVGSNLEYVKFLETGTKPH